MELSQLPLVLLLISNIHSGHTEDKVKLSVSPQKWLTEGDPVTLICEVKGNSTGWTFSWFTETETVSSGSKYHYKLLSDSSRGAGGKYTVSSAAVNHTGVYVCGAKREKTDYITYSNKQPLWVTGVSPRVSLIISPSRTQHFSSVSLSLSCKDQSNSDGWTIRRYTDSWRLEDCSSSVSGSQTGSTCTISSTIPSHTGVYWCQSESGEKYHPVNITVQTDITGVILESPVHPVTEGDTLTLRCLDKFADPSIVRADFYKDGSLIQNQTTEMIISTVSKSHEGFYYCKYLEGGESLKSRISVRVGVILESPVHPVTEGDSLTLRCLYKHPNPSNPRADFYKDGSLIQNQTTEMIISTVSKSHEGLYYCKHPETKKESTKRWISVRERPKPKVIIKPDQHVFSGETVTLRCDIDAEGVTSWRFNWYKEGSTSVFSEHQEHTFRSVTESDAGKYSCNGSDTEGSHRSHISDEVTLTVSRSDGLKPVIIGVIAGLTAVFLIIVFLVLLWHFRNNKGGRSESPSAVSQQQNISQTSEQNQSEAGYNTPLSDGVSEITYAEVELKSTNKQKKEKENKDKNTESCDVLYSKLKLETDQGAGSSDATYAQVK